MTLADRWIDRLARRPHGPLGRWLYRHAPGHGPGFETALRVSPPTSGEAVLEVGCGGGIVLERILSAGASAVGVDHSADMLAISRTRNREAAARGRLRLIEADAGRLPLADRAFDRVFCLNAFFFFPEPERAMAEMVRVAKPSATIAILTAPPELAPKIGRVFSPMARAMRFHSPETMERWLRSEGARMSSLTQVKGAGFLIAARKESIHE